MHPKSTRLICASFGGIRLIMCILHDHKAVMTHGISNRKITVYTPKAVVGLLLTISYIHPFMFIFSNKGNMRNRPTRDKKDA